MTAGLKVTLSNELMVNFFPRSVPTSLVDNDRRSGETSSLVWDGADCRRRFGARQGRCAEEAGLKPALTQVGTGIDGEPEI